MDWYLKVLKNYFNFSGRARRKEYWMFVLFSVIIAIVLGVVDGVLGMTVANGAIGLLGLVYTLAVLIPSIALGIRRLHDIDRSGWWTLIALIPFIGGLVLLVWACSEGTHGDNRFGADPKLDEGDGVAALA
ncbi:MAG: Inner membrane protein YhaH [uncultured Lysobacter sp.]|uniref:Inner membrane protein YhaH n=1 Tax=uncultured Lysobacter sp. TaxID=271060 RepID=A0A6J4KEX8_9GAMM|nr:MAG: Inner membrane protein YhaH [uncultured Lysobacter sp.]